MLDIEADGSAIKTERFVWTMPRLAEIEEDEDPVERREPGAAGGGLTVVRTGQALDTRRGSTGRPRCRTRTRQGNRQLLRPRTSPGACA